MLLNHANRFMILIEEKASCYSNYRIKGGFVVLFCFWPGNTEHLEVPTFSESEMHPYLLEIKNSCLRLAYVPEEAIRDS